MSLLLMGNNGFTQGWLNYIDYYPGFTRDARIVFQVKFGNLEPTYVIADTGSAWCILSPEDANDLDFDYRTLYEERISMLIRGVRYDGWLCRIPIELEAKEGKGLTVESTTFIPDVSDNLLWNVPNFVGLAGFLDRMHYAVSSTLNRFYFGAVTVG